jgi:hypothetical protein
MICKALHRKLKIEQHQTHLQEEQTIQWLKEDEQTIQCLIEEEQTIQWLKEEKQTIQWLKEDEQTIQCLIEEEQTIQWIRPVVSGSGVARSLVFCVVLCRSLLVVIYF